MESSGLSAVGMTGIDGHGDRTRSRDEGRYLLLLGLFDLFGLSVPQRHCINKAPLPLSGVFGHKTPVFPDGEGDTATQTSLFTRVAKNVDTLDRLFHGNKKIPAEFDKLFVTFGKCTHIFLKDFN